MHLYTVLQPDTACCLIQPALKQTLIPYLSQPCPYPQVQLLDQSDMQLLQMLAILGITTSVDAKHHGVSLSEQWNVTWVGKQQYMYT